VEESGEIKKNSENRDLSHFMVDIVTIYEILSDYAMVRVSTFTYVTCVELLIQNFMSFKSL